MWTRRPKAEDLASMDPEKVPFETCLLQKLGESCWTIWDTRDLNFHQSAVLEDALPVTERLAVFRTRRGPKWEFQQFQELSAAVRAHWDKSSGARARLANRHRRAVGLKPGDGVVWNAPRPAQSVVDVRGHRLTLEPPVPDPPKALMKLMLVPPDAP